jgi:hypothetical protein
MIVVWKTLGIILMVAVLKLSIYVFGLEVTIVGVLAGLIVDLMTRDLTEM